MIQTEYEFILPIGYQDEEGRLHREGIMRLATAADEILPLNDPRVQKNQAYLVMILFSRVITCRNCITASIAPAKLAWKRLVRSARTNLRWSSKPRGGSRLPPPGAL
jgi:hypothetical protein